MLTCRACQSLHVAGVEYEGTPEDWDGVSEWVCLDCGARIGRWSSKRLDEGELEPKYLRHLKQQIPGIL